MGSHNTMIKAAGRKLRKSAGEWKASVTEQNPHGDFKKLYAFIVMFRKEKELIGISFNKANLEHMKAELRTARDYYMEKGLLYEEYKSGSKIKAIALTSKKKISA